MTTSPFVKPYSPSPGLARASCPPLKVMAKEMLPLVDMPLIQNAVEEARAAGIEEFIFVTSRGKAMIDDHFDLSAELLRTSGSARQDVAEIAIAKAAQIRTG